jgi:A/G-specific adenine glycosylase
MAEPPTSEWTPNYDLTRARRDAPLDARWKRLPGVVRHTFTHFPLELTVFFAEVAGGARAPHGTRWTPRSSLAEEALPGVMRKVLAHALERQIAPATSP